MPDDLMIDYDNTLGANSNSGWPTSGNFVINHQLMAVLTQLLKMLMKPSWSSLRPWQRKTFLKANMLKSESLCKNT